MNYRLLLACASLLVFLTGCETLTTMHTPYAPIAYKPKNPGDVVIKVSLSNRMVYVLEGKKPLLITATAIGKPGHATPTGHFSVISKTADKRSGEYGFWVSENTGNIVSGEAGARPGPGYHYVGYPMPFYVEFTPGYGFHVGSVWPVPRSHGCLRIHKNVGQVFFELARIGTPVIIAYSLPEDQTIGKDQPRPQDYADPDLPNSYLVSHAAFHLDPAQYLHEQN